MFTRSRPHKDREKDDREKLKKVARPAEEKKRRKRSKGTDENRMSGSDRVDSSKARRTPDNSKSVQGINAEARSSRGSLPYPSFSKAHSRESVLPVGTAGHADIMTPDATEVGGNDSAQRVSGQAPPSPPLTGVEETKHDARRSQLSKASTTQTTDTKQSVDTARKDGERKPPKGLGVEGSVLSSPAKTSSTLFSDGSGSIIDSEATSRAQGDSEATSRARGTGLTNLAAHSHPPSPVTPIQTPLSFTSSIDPEPQVGLDTPRFPPPPPPPPPPFVPQNVPRVDYLLNHGGLTNTVPRTLLGAQQAKSTAQEYPSYIPTRAPAPPSAEIDKIFLPYHDLLDNYATVLSKSGSLAVATGYKSVARRLLDRLENVFARDISSHMCHCVMCQNQDESQPEPEKLGWGEVLEWVGGRREVPVWPAFDFGAVNVQLTTKRTKTPLQQIDADVPDEYRDHYLRQSAKTKKAVDKWLMAQPEAATSPPQEVDDETLTFAILTHLDQNNATLFTKLLMQPKTATPNSRAPTPAKARSETLEKQGVALQRLYRLSLPPRDPETAIFLVRHPPLHNVLATLSAINVSEWDVLTSGRFDGFLWSGAEEVDKTASRLPSRVASRGVAAARKETPLQSFMATASRAPTPSQTPGGPGPVPYDEETEVAVLAEIEREIYVGMEALEDAFEALHRKAESVRQRLRERGAGLSSGATVEVLAGTPDPGGYGWGAASEADEESDVDWKGIAGIDSSLSELAPDDSASNISSSRHRRPKRRNERRTPAPVEEDLDEDDLHRL